MDLPTRKFGRTGLDVAVLGFGAMELRGPGQWSGRSLAAGQAEPSARRCSLTTENESARPPSLQGSKSRGPIEARA